MEGVGSRLGRASARYGPTQTVFNGPVRKWKKKWVHVSSSSSSSSSAVTQSNSHNRSSGGSSSSSSDSNNGNNTSPLLLCRWTPLSSNPSDTTGAPPDEPPKRRFRYTPIAVLEERKKAVEEKDETEAKESETNLFTDWSPSKTDELNVDNVLTKETQEPNTSHLDLDLCLKGHNGDLDSASQSKEDEDQQMKPELGDLF